MNKKGFTLVELLAVIAILAILVIVALPNVLSMYRDARKNTFTNEVSSVLRSARQQYLVDGGVACEYTNADGYTNNLKYFVKLDGNGNVIELQATNGTYQYNKKGTIEIINSSDVVDVNDLDDNEKLVVTGTSNTNVKQLFFYSNHIRDNETIPFGVQTYNSYQDVINSIGHPFFAKNEYENYRLESKTIWCLIDPEYGNSCDDIEPFYYDTEEACNHFAQNGITCQSRTISVPSGDLVSSYVGFVKNGNVYYLKSNDRSSSAYDANKAILEEIFGSSNCREYNSCGKSFNCSDSSLNIHVNPIGGVSVSDYDANIHLGDSYVC